ncbi:tannase/feruloyl esterase family alpha/beta hydrolase [Burkholderia ambifaria]|uniref:tannase/feruloyl esterase family alpha/beta hydrolase n=1 Tax=Burkholderia ambifaria TaxID=152480 RepID=UPI001FC7CCC0|nr:tannase/feruloyl esterase family alpha/beta hydrolase [Burkholderia ambifaria]
MEIEKSPHLPAAAFAIFVATGLTACGGGSESTSITPIVSAQQACDSLGGKSVGGATVTAATIVGATATVPAYCKISATISPSLNLELDLPNNWNGKLVYEGGGGYDGSIQGVVYSPGVLGGGYAVVQSNGGHIGAPLDASFASDPHLASLFGSGSVPTAAAAAKEMLKFAYGNVPQRSYYEGCSNGGREGLMAAQRNPDLFDGVIARAPAYNWTGTMGMFNRMAKALGGAGAAFTHGKVATLATAVRSACDGNDGAVDGVVSNPSACHFDPNALRCPNGADSGDSCLSDPQLAVVTSWTTSASFGNGAYVSPGWALSGNEDDPGSWATWLTGSTGNGSNGLQNLLQDTTVKNYLVRDPNANSLAYDWNSNPEAILALGALNDATDTNLTPFKNTGAKLILWHGTSDSALTYRATTAYYEGLKTAMGGQTATDSFVRYYLAPGVNHCIGGAGADTVDLVSALDNWVTQGIDPGQPIAAKLNTDGSLLFTRPLCKYPQYPRYTGPANDANAAKDASNYTCTTP